MMLLYPTTDGGLSGAGQKAKSTPKVVPFGSGLPPRFLWKQTNEERALANPSGLKDDTGDSAVGGQQRQASAADSTRAESPAAALGGSPVDLGCAQIHIRCLPAETPAQSGVEWF